MMQGPYTSYRRREADLYFDLERKYEHCPYCGSDVDFVDLEVLIGTVSSKLPPSVARAFAMESIRMYGVVPEKVVNLLYSVMDDVQGNAEISKENLDLLETFTKTSHDLYNLKSPARLNRKSAHLLLGSAISKSKVVGPKHNPL